MVFEKEYIMQFSSLLFILEGRVPSDDAIMVLAGKLRESHGFLSLPAQFSVWKTTGKDSSEPYAIANQNYTIYSVFPSGMTSHSKIALFNCV